jgi:hypothetical protein
MTTFAFVVTANDLQHRLMAANMILSSKEYGDYRWYAAMDKPLGVGERFIEMTWGEKQLWPTVNNPRKKLLKFASLGNAMSLGNEDYLIHVDCDCVFRGAPPVNRLFEAGYRSFCFVEGDLLNPAENHVWKWPADEIRKWVRSMGYPYEKFRNNLGGFFGVRRDAWPDFMALVDRALGALFRHNLWGFLPWFSDEPPLAYAVQMQSQDKIEGLQKEKNLDIFLSTDVYPERPLRFKHWAMKQDMPVPDKIGVVHAFGKYDNLASDGLLRLQSLGKRPPL